MPERSDARLPEPEDIIKSIAKELGLDPHKKPVLEEQYPTEQLFPEEAPTPDGRYIAGSCLEQIYNLSLKHTPPGRPLLLSPKDVRCLYREFHQITLQAWEASPDLPGPFPNVTLTHLLGAAKRQIALLAGLKAFHETDTFDPALGVYRTIGRVIERAILDGDPDPQYLGGQGDQATKPGR